MFDLHACPVMPAGPVVGPCVPTVLTGKMPQGAVGDQCACIGPPDPVVKGSLSVFAGKRPTARIGDLTGKGGGLITGFPTVIIGDKSGGAVVGGPLRAGAGTPDCMRKAAQGGAAFVQG
jgi:uncharacterized Zn-binding protein involved in type VI secretion